MALPSVHDALSGPAAVRAKPNLPFLLVHHAGARGSWEVTPDGKYLPVLLETRMVPGANGFRTVERGQPANQLWDGAVRHFERDGSLVLLPTSEYAGVKYLSSVPAINPRNGAEGRHYHLWCETVKPPARAEGKTRVVRDAKVYDEWRAALVLDGTIPLPPDDVHEWIVAAAETDLREAEKVMSPEIRTRLVAAAREVLDRVKAAKPPSAPAEPEKRGRGAR